MSTPAEMLAAWLDGVPTGGPGGDGRYPLVYKDGATYMVYCPAAQALNPLLSEQPIEMFSITASNAAATAAAEADEATQASIDAQTAAANAAASAAAAEALVGHVLAVATDGSVLPDVDAVRAFGSATKRWGSSYFGDWMIVGDSGAGASIQADGNDGSFSDYYFSKEGVGRWDIYSDYSDEAGGDTGGKWNLLSYSDAGVANILVMQASRVDGRVTFWVPPIFPTATAGDSSTKAATTAYAKAAAPNASYRTLLDCSASHTAARAAGTYWMGQGDPAGVTGVGTLYPPNIIYIDPADYPTVNGLTTKLRLRAVVAPNDVAPGGTYTFGLYPVTRPATSGGAALGIIAMGTVIAGSTAAVTPAADGLHNVASADFAIPAAGFYVIGFVTSAVVATSSHVMISTSLQQRNT